MTKDINGETYFTFFSVVRGISKWRHTVDDAALNNYLPVSSQSPSSTAHYTVTDEAFRFHVMQHTKPL